MVFSLRAIFLKTMDEILLQILAEENELDEIEKKLNGLKLAYEFRNNELLTVEGELFLTVDSLITLNNYITDSNNLSLRQINVKPAFYNKLYMDFRDIETQLYILIDQFNDRYISTRDFCKKFLDEIHQFSDGNGRTLKILFANHYGIRQRNNLSDNHIFFIHTHRPNNVLSTTTMRIYKRTIEDRYC